MPEENEVTPETGESGQDGTAAKPTETVEFWKSKAREQEKRAKANADAAKRLSEIEEAQKTEQQKSAEAREAAERKASEAQTNALKLEVALDKAPDGMSLAQVRKLAKRLTGSSQEELESDADELFGEFGPKEKPKPGEQQRPKERLTPVPLEGGDKAKAEMTDMNAWMRSKASSE